MSPTKRKSVRYVFMSIFQDIDTCLQTRALAAKAVGSVLQSANGISESEFADKFNTELRTHKNFHPGGWYDPPPNGVAVLFAESNNFQRLQFDTLRKQQYWPKQEIKLGENSVGMVYASPVDNKSGIIGDIGLSFYTGQDQKIKQHLIRSLEVIKKAAEFADVKMEFRELHNHAQKLFAKASLNNDRTVTYADSVGTNLGHAIPWTHKDPTESEQAIISGSSFEKLKNLISSKRVNVNSRENFKIPENIVFTFEARLEDSNDLQMPSVFYHLLVAFKEGEREIISGFEGMM